MKGWLRYDDKANENASVLSSLPTEDYLYRCPTFTNLGMKPLIPEEARVATYYIVVKSYFMVVSYLPLLNVDITPTYEIQ